MLTVPDYTIEANGEKIHLLFNTYMFKKFSARKGWELHELLSRVQSMLQGGSGFGTGEISDVLLAAHQSYCDYNKIEFNATDLEASLWIDSMGGLINGVERFGEIMKLFVAKLLNISTDELQTRTNEVEKKREVSQTKASGGTTSTSKQRRQA